MQVPVHKLDGAIANQIEVSDYVFGAPFNEAVVHQAMVRQLANARQGTSDTKTRGEVAGSGKKPFAQKHTGRARAGSVRSPIHRKGGIVFGPKPRSYRQAMPKKMRRLALRCAISAKARDNGLTILEEVKLPEPKTKEMERVLTALGVSSSALIVTAEPEENLIQSARNLPGIKTTVASVLNVVDLLSYDKLLMTVDAVRKAEELWGKKNAPVSDTAAPASN